MEATRFNATTVRTGFLPEENLVLSSMTPRQLEDSWQITYASPEIMARACLSTGIGTDSSGPKSIDLSPDLQRPLYNNFPIPFFPNSFLSLLHKEQLSNELIVSISGI